MKSFVRDPIFLSEGNRLGGAKPGYGGGGLPPGYGGTVPRIRPVPYAVAVSG